MDANSEIKFDPKKHEGEYKRICNECGKMWHSSYNLETQLELSTGIASLQILESALTLTNDQKSTQADRNLDANLIELNKLRACPNCGSKNYSETFQFFPKRTQPSSPSEEQGYKLGCVVMLLGLIVMFIKFAPGVFFILVGSLMAVPDNQFVAFGREISKKTKNIVLGLLALVGILLLISG